MKRFDLFVIDGQNDFCASGKEPKDWPAPFGGHRAGALSVVGADEEAVRVANFINDLAVSGNKKHLITKIHVSLDSHHVNDCAHNTVWRDKNGQIPNPFTIVTHQNIVNQDFFPVFTAGVFDGKRVSAYEWAEKYTSALDKKGRNPLCLWPEHCLIQSWGSSIYYPLQEAYNTWERLTGRWVNFITKGSYPFTEHYSAMGADVPDPSVRETGLNIGVINDASEADVVIWCGWAGSHCLKWTALDAINYFSSSGENEFIRKSVFIEDACAAVQNPPGGPDFSQWRKDFLKEVVDRGGRVVKCKDLIAEIKAA